MAMCGWGNIRGIRVGRGIPENFSAPGHGAGKAVHETDSGFVMVRARGAKHAALQQAAQHSQQQQQQNGGAAHPLLGGPPVEGVSAEEQVLAPLLRPAASTTLGPCTALCTGECTYRAAYCTPGILTTTPLSRLVALRPPSRFHVHRVGRVCSAQACGALLRSPAPAPPVALCPAVPSSQQLPRRGWGSCPSVF